MTTISPPVERPISAYALAVFFCKPSCINSELASEATCETTIDMLPDEVFARVVYKTFDAVDLVILSLVSKKLKRVAYIAAARRLRTYRFFMPPLCPARWNHATLQNDIQRLRICQARSDTDTVQNAYAALRHAFPGDQLQTLFRARGMGLDTWTLVRIVADSPFSLARLSSQFKARSQLKAHAHRDVYAIEYIRALCKLGVDPRIPDEKGVTPVEHARKEGRDDIIRVLESYM
jgi:hypothetical protein